MDAKEFKSWRERVGLTQQQIADRLRVTRTTVQNWEGGVSPIPQAVDMSCDIWEARLKQENPNFGPVTLIYSDGPMFVDPYGPRRRPAMMQQEPYPTNSAALARVQQLAGRRDFHNPFIIDKSNTPIWNLPELMRAIDGSDTGAPTLTNLLRTIAKHVRADSTNFVRGAKSPSPSEKQERQRAIEDQADELDRIADSGWRAIIRDQLRIEAVFSQLLALGTRAPDSLVSNVHQALVVFEQNHRPEDEMGQFEEAEEELRKIATKNVNVSVCKPQIILHGPSSFPSLEITCDDQGLFRLKEDIGNRRNGGFQTQITPNLARWSGNEPPIAKNEMLAKAQDWLRSLH